MPNTIRRDAELPMQTRELPVSVDNEARTVDVVFSAGATVRRYRWQGWDRVAYDETLVVSSAAINMERLSAGGPALDSHDTWSTRSQVAVVDKAWIENGQAMARLRFPSAGIDEAADRMWGLVSEGIIRNVSVGYSQDEVRVVEAEKKGQAEQWIVERWTPFEISFVTVPADARAQTRAQVRDARPDGGERLFRAVIISNEEQPMPDTVRNEPGADPATEVTRATAPVQQDMRAEVEAATKAERARVSDITTLARQHGMSDEFLRAQIVGGVSVADTGRLILDELAKKAKATDTGTMRVLTDEGDTRRAAVENAILHRAAPSATQLTDAAREWRGMSLLELGRVYLEETHGVRLRGLGKLEAASVLLGMETRAGMLSTSDFPLLLANVTSKRLRDGYGAATQTWKPFSRQSNVADFKDRTVVMMTGLPDLQRVREGQEYTYASFGETSTKYAIGTYGRIVAVTRQTLINDDLGAFDRIPTLFGRAAAEFESDTVWNLLLSNQTMNDGTALFHANHGNLAATGGDPSETTVQAADIAMGAQVGAAGKPLNLKARYLAVSRKHKVAAQKLLTSIQATKTGDVNVYHNSMEPIVEDRLYNPAGNSPWFMIGDPGQWDTLEYAYLEGSDGLYTESRLGFEVDGVQIKARLDFGASAIDWKAFYKNPGN
jgi:hypothetical protein